MVPREVLKNLMSVWACVTQRQFIVLGLTMMILPILVLLTDLTSAGASCSSGASTNASFSAATASINASFGAASARTGASATTASASTSTSSATADADAVAAAATSRAVTDQRESRCDDVVGGEQLAATDSGADGTTAGDNGRE